MLLFLVTINYNHHHRYHHPHNYCYYVFVCVCVTQWHGSGEDARIAINRLGCWQLCFPAATLGKSFIHIRVSVTKPYTTSPVSHWPCATDKAIHPCLWVHGLWMRDAYPHVPKWASLPFYVYDTIILQQEISQETKLMYNRYYCDNWISHILTWLKANKFNFYMPGNAMNNSCHFNVNIQQICANFGLWNSRV